MRIGSRFKDNSRDSRVFVIVMVVNILLVGFIWFLGLFSSLVEASFIDTNTSTLLSDSSVVGVSSVNSDGSLVLVDGSTVSSDSISGSYVVSKGLGDWYSKDSKSYIRDMGVWDWIRLFVFLLLGGLELFLVRLLRVSRYVVGWVRKVMIFLKTVFIFINLLGISGILLLLLG